MPAVLGSLQHLPRKTLREEALEQIRLSILNGSLAPGTALGEVAVAEQLGVSRGTVREALRTLQQEGLVEPHGRGLRVRRLDPREVVELFEVRASLEATAARAVMLRDDVGAVVDRLESLLPDETADELTYAERLDVDLAFHRALVAASRNSLLLEMWTMLENSVRVVVLADSGRSQEPVMTRAHHESIVEAMRSGDSEAAQTVIHEHMETSSAVFAQSHG